MDPAGLACSRAVGRGLHDARQKPVRGDGHGCHAVIIRRRLQELAAEIEQRSADLDSGWTWPDSAPMSGVRFRRLAEIINASAQA
jgi:hypothetical protein